MKFFRGTVSCLEKQNIILNRKFGLAYWDHFSTFLGDSCIQIEGLEVLYNFNEGT